jgi:TPR repeat protein
MDSKECFDDDGVAYQWESQVFEKIHSEAESGDAASQFRLALLFSGETGVITPNPQKQAEWYQKAAEQDHLPAMNNLACMYRDGIGVNQSKEKAFELFLKAAQNELMLAQYNVARCFELGEGVVKNLDSAFDWYNAASKQGDAISLFKCGCFYFDGIGCPKDKKLGFDFFKQSAEKGHTQSIYLVGYCLQNGFGTEYSDSFVAWYQRAADAGHARASLKLALIYDDGFSVPSDYDKVIHYLNHSANCGNAEAKFRLYEKLSAQITDESGRQRLRQLLEQAAESGFKDARNKLAECLLEGDLFSKDVDRSIQLMERSVDDGDHGVYSLLDRVAEGDLTSARSDALLRITKKSADLFNQYAAFQYAQQLEANGSQEDLEEAHKYYSSAAALGHYAAALNLARCYQLGIGCNESLPRETASIYFHQAFVVGVLADECLGKLAGMFADGVGLPKNYVFAYALSNFAGAAGDDGAIALRDSLEAKMSPEQIGKAQDMSQEWSDLSQIKDHKLFPDWMREPPAYTLLTEESNVKRLSQETRWGRAAESLLQYLKVNKDFDKREKQ